MRVYWYVSAKLVQLKKSLLLYFYYAVDSDSSSSRGRLRRVFQRGNSAPGELVGPALWSHAPGVGSHPSPGAPMN
jgi:hypothetical protein